MFNLKFEDIKDISSNNYTNADSSSYDTAWNYLFSDSEDKNYNSNNIINSYEEINDTNDTNDNIYDDNESININTSIPGLSGLVNMGNTCYLNAALQSLRYTPVFFAFIINKTYFNDLKKNIHETLVDKKRKELNLEIDNHIDIDIEQDELFEECDSSVTSLFYSFLIVSWGENCKISPESLKNKLSEYNDEFIGYSQNDSQELIHLFFDRIHEETKTSVNILIPDKSLVNGLDDIIDKQNNIIDIKNNDKITDKDKQDKFYEYKDYREKHRTQSIILKSYIEWKKFIENDHSIIRDLFTNIIYEKKTCDYCEHSSNMFEFLTTLPIQIPSENLNVSIYDCFKDFVAIEKMIGENKLKCSNCNTLSNATKRSFLWQTSEYLIIHLMRFKKEYNYGNISVLKMNSIVTFPLEDLNLSDFQSDIYKQSDTRYNLYSVLMHSGNYSGGHYYSYCKSPVNNKWYLFNDTHVEYIPDDIIEDKLLSSNAYLLFYQKKSIFE